MFVKDILAGKRATTIYSVSKSDRISSVAGLLSKHRIGVAMVREGDGPLEGILSERDIVRELGNRGSECLTETAADLMTTKITTCTPNSSVQEIMSKMTAGKFRHIPVMEDGALIGVISIGDVVAARMDEVERENDVMLEMITGQV